jgi:hypothetical protein
MMVYGCLKNTSTSIAYDISYTIYSITLVPYVSYCLQLSLPLPADPLSPLVERKAADLLQLADELLRCPYAPICLMPINLLMDSILPVTLPQQYNLMSNKKTAKAAAAVVMTATKLSSLITAMLQKTLSSRLNGNERSSSGGSKTNAGGKLSRNDHSRSMCTAVMVARSSSGITPDIALCSCGIRSAGGLCPTCGPVVEPSELTPEGWPAWLWFKVEAQPYVAYMMLSGLLATMACRAQSILDRYVQGSKVLLTMAKG